VIAGFSIVPLGSGESLSPAVAEAFKTLEASGRAMNITRWEGISRADGRRHGRDQGLS